MSENKFELANGQEPDADSPAPISTATRLLSAYAVSGSGLRSPLASKFKLAQCEWQGHPNVMAYEEAANGAASNSWLSRTINERVDFLSGQS